MCTYLSLRGQDGFMRKIRFFSILLAILALALFFPGCEDDPPIETPPPPPPPVATNNGSVFCAKITSTLYLYVSIYSETSRLVSPKSGDSYAVALISVDSDGNLAYDGVPKSAGTITVANGMLNFTPSANYPGQQAGSGTLNGNTLTMQRVPGTPYTTPINLTIRSDVIASSSGPFGSNNSGLTIPPNSGSPGGSTGGSSNKTPPAPSEPFVAGRYVKNVEWKTLPKITKVYEGMKVDLAGTGFEVLITYDDDSTTTVTSPSSVKVYPPYYWKAEGEHTLRYIDEYNTAEPLKFKAPKDNRNAEKQEDRSYFYTLDSGTPDVSGAASIKYFPGFGESELDTSGVTLTGHYTYRATATATTDTKETYPLAFAATSTYTPSPKSCTAIFTYGYDTNTSAYKTVSYNLLPDNIYELDKIVVSKAPSFSQQITFDDKRFFGSDQDKHWFGHMKDAQIGLVYKNTPTTKAIRLVEAAMYGGSNKLTINSLPTDFFTGKTHQLKFNYYISNPIELDIPVYDTLVGITIEGSGTIELNGTTPDNEMSFLRLVTVSAIYQKGTNRNVSVKKPIYVRNDQTNPPTVVFDQWKINGSAKTNVHTDSSKGGILNAANSTSYEKNGKPIKAIIDFETKDGSNLGETYRASYTIDVGVKGYGIRDN